MQELEHRVIKLEVRVDNHEEDLAELRDTSVKLTESLQSIEKTLAQLKWIATGAIVALIAKDIGLYNVLKTVIGV